MTNVVIELVKAPYIDNPKYKLNFTDSVAAVETAASLKVILPKLLRDSIALWWNVDIYTETVSEEAKPE